MVAVAIKKTVALLRGSMPRLALLYMLLWEMVSLNVLVPCTYAPYMAAWAMTLTSMTADPPMALLPALLARDTAV